MRGGHETNMRFVPTKTAEQQSLLMLHRARHLFIREQTAIINSVRDYLAEFGIVAPLGGEASSNCWKSSLIKPKTESRRSPGCALLLLAVNCAR